MYAVRAFRQASLCSTRAFAVRTASRSLTRAVLPTLATRSIAANASRAFSVSARHFGEGSCKSSPNLSLVDVAELYSRHLVADVALATKLSEELQYETEAAEQTEPEFLTNFKSHGIWDVSKLLLCEFAGSEVDVDFRSRTLLVSMKLRSNASLATSRRSY